MNNKDDWAGDAQNRTNNEKGEFVRDTNYIDDRIVNTVEPGSDPVEQPDGTYAWPVEKGRYRSLLRARAPGHTAPLSLAGSTAWKMQSPSA